MSSQVSKQCKTNQDTPAVVLVLCALYRDKFVVQVFQNSTVACRVLIDSKTGQKLAVLHCHLWSLHATNKLCSHGNTVRSDIAQDSTNKFGICKCRMQPGVAVTDYCLEPGMCLLSRLGRVAAGDNNTFVYGAGCKPVW